MTLIFHPEADDEFQSAIEYYEQQQEGLGFEFFFEIQNALARIEGHSSSWPIFEGPIRRCMVNRFPYAVLYANEGSGQTVVVAVMHLHRESSYWKKRLSDEGG